LVWWRSASVEGCDPAERMALVVRSERAWTIDKVDSTDPKASATKRLYGSELDPARLAESVGALTQVPPGIQLKDNVWGPLTRVLLGACGGRPREARP
jgi:hypothetical protein